MGNVLLLEGQFCAPFSCSICTSGSLWYIAGMTSVYTFYLLVTWYDMSKLFSCTTSSREVRGCRNWPWFDNWPCHHALMGPQVIRILENRNSFFFCWFVIVSVKICYNGWKIQTDYGNHFGLCFTAAILLEDLELELLKHIVLISPIETIWIWQNISYDIWVCMTTICNNFCYLYWYSYFILQIDMSHGIVE